MASASVSVTGDLPAACLGSVGRFRANGPVAAHPNGRMPRIPFRVVPELHCAQIRKGYGSMPELCTSLWSAAGRAISPELQRNVYRGTQVLARALPQSES